MPLPVRVLSVWPLSVWPFSVWMLSVELTYPDEMSGGGHAGSRRGPVANPPGGPAAGRARSSHLRDQIGAKSVMD